MRILDVIEVHAPQLGPTPGTLEVQAGYGPQGVARLDGIALWRVGSQLAQGYATLCDHVGGLLLGSGYGIVLGPRRRGHQCTGNGGQRGQLAERYGGCGHQMCRHIVRGFQKRT